MTLTIDLNDRKILYELDRDSRQPNKQIAKKVHLSEQVVGNRIKRLIENKIIDYFFVKTNPSSLGYIHLKIAFRLHNLTKEKEEQFLKELQESKGIFWLVSLRGKFDLISTLYVKNFADFSNYYEEIFGKWGDYILDRNITILERAYTYTQVHLWPKQKAEEILYTKGSEEKVELGQKDLEILRILNKNGRMPLIEIAQKAGISADTVNYRLRNLEKKRVITGFGVKINFARMGNSYSLIYLKLQNMNKEKYAKLETIAKYNKNIIIYVKSLGNHDIEFEVITSNKEELDTLIRELKDCFVTEIKDYEILEVTQEHRLTYFPF
ncbi:MAG: Lrp/AsnC family transcriptional regulator [Nanoarchaeota archaeon]